MNNQPPRAAWTTYDELKYLGGIPSRLPREQAAIIIRNYIKAIFKRQRWNFIKKDKVLKFAHNILEELEGSDA